MRKYLILFVGLAACGGTEPTRAPAIAFDKATYVVTLNASGTVVASKPTPIVTITAGSDALPPIVSIGLDPDGYCNVGAGVGFASSSAQWTRETSEASLISRPIDFNVCPSITGAQTVPKGSTTIHATYSFNGATYTAAATVVVQ